MESKNERKGKALLVLPLLVIPFLTLAFWALGGGKAAVQPSASSQELNMQLPEAHLKNDKGEDKLSFYEEAEKDSARFRQEIKKDPLYDAANNEDTGLLEIEPDNFTRKPGIYKDPNEEKIYRKLAELNRQLNSNTPIERQEAVQPQSTPVNKGDVDRLESLMQQMKKDSGVDPEMNQLNGMMDKIIAIQHPEKIRDKQSSQVSSVVFKVSNQSADDTIVNGFYSLDEPDETAKSNAIEAVVNDDQELVSGSIIKLRLIDDAFIKEVKIPAGNFVYGVALLDGERLNVKVNSIRVGNSIYPVKIKVYDMDGLEGIYIPGAINRDVAKQSADNSMQTMQLASLDPSLAAQATAAGISTAKKLLSKKMKLVKVMVKAGYRILLKDASQKK